MSHPATLFRRLVRLAPAPLLAACVAAGMLIAGPALEAADDIDLLREPGAFPYVMILLDTSGSMALSPPTSTKKDDFGDWTGAGADDPGSKLFQVKKALYEVISGVENVNFGFATYNQDELQVSGKHWLYRPTTSASFLTGLFTYPEAVPDTDAAVREKSWVFGRLFENDATLGSCGSPLDLSQDRRYLDRYARLGVNGDQTTDFWIADKGRTFRVRVQPVGGSVDLGTREIDVEIVVDEFEVVTNACQEVSLTPERETITFERVAPFLMVEAPVGNEGSTYPLPASQEDQCDADETLAGYFNYQDVAAVGTCGSGSNHPFTGDGWESNADSGARDDDLLSDLYCDPESDRDSNPEDCLNLRFFTEDPHPLGRELDLGDIVPWDWDNEYKHEVLRRLNPRHPEPPPEAPAADPDTGLVDPQEQRAYERELQRYFGVAPFFADAPGDLPGALALKNPDQKPILAFGNSPFARAVNDVYCWYLGGDNLNKCKSDSDEGGSEFDKGWKVLYEGTDLFAGCQERHLIVITDGEDNAAGQNASSEVTELNKDAGFKATIFSFQDTQTFQSFKSNADADLVLVQDGDDLRQKLEDVIGSIEQDSRTFATAAVPSVQSTAAQNIYITNFEPRNDHGIWEGHVQAFGDDFKTLKPTDDAFLWDAAVQMKDQAHDPVTGSTAETDLKIENETGGTPDTLRRPLYSKDRKPNDGNLDSWPENRTLFDRTGDDSRTGSSDDEPTDREVDFWDGFGIPYDPDDPASVDNARIRGNRIVETTLIEKVRTNDDGTTENYILGDIFHFDPLLVGGPRNTLYFSQDAEETFDGNGEQQGTGYQEFFNQHENRRRVLFAGANDGMLHAFDAGRAAVERLAAEEPNPERDVVRYNEGTGKEIFSYIPRSLLPTVRDLAESPVGHRWGVDAPAAGGDVFIDPLHTGTPTVAEREWRSILVGGLREGGVGYYALDITHPDELVTASVGPVEANENERRDVQVPADQDEVVPGCYDDGSTCDTLNYPAPLWEFYDRVWNEATLEYVLLDEDDVDGDGTPTGNDKRDLAETWSRPNIGRIKVENPDGDVVNKYVAVFGGGLDPLKVGDRGNWIYILDVETGNVLYKREVEGSVPADAAAVDTDADGFLDRIYAGTTAGFMYRVDLVEVNASTGQDVFPRIEENVSVPAIKPDGTNTTVMVDRIEDTDLSGDPVWEPKKIFTTGGRPIYFRPAVLFVANLGEYALAFGTGDRDDLTTDVDQEGRFYVFLDETEDPTVATQLPLDETNFTAVDTEDGENNDLLTDSSIPAGEKGWFMTLEPNERLIGNPFGFSGITFFATFEPEPPTDAETCSASNSPKDCTPQCDLNGTSRVYLVGTTDADAFLTDPDDDTLTKRFREIQGFVTNPFTEQAVTTSGSSDGDDGGDGGDGGTGDDDGTDRGELTEAERELMEKLQSLFPDNCKFGNHRIDVNVIQSETVSIERVATVPICIIEKNWKEF